MKIAGQQISGPNEVLIVIPRPDRKIKTPILEDGKPVLDEMGIPKESEAIIQGNIAFKAKAILDYSPFDKMCPRPEAPIMLLPGGVQKRNTESPEFKKKVERYSTIRFAWIVITSLAATPDLTWDKVKSGEAETWPLYEEELQEAGFSYIEIGRITNCVLEANCLDEEKVNEARKSFLALPAQQAGQ